MAPTNKEVNMKIPAKRIDSSDCIVYPSRVIEGGVIVDQGEGFAVHEGEWVEIIPVRSLKENFGLLSLIKDDKQKIGSALIDICETLSKRITGWNWTDNNGEDLPNPHNKPEILHELTEDEIAWLMTAVKGETPGGRKNVSEPSTEA